VGKDIWGLSGVLSAFFCAERLVQGPFFGHSGFHWKFGRFSLVEVSKNLCRFMSFRIPWVALVFRWIAFPFLLPEAAGRLL
jgi:hypothetical protein